MEIPIEKGSFWIANSTKYFSEPDVRLFFKYLEEFLAFCMDDLLIYSQTEEHLKYPEFLKNLQRLA